MTRTRPQWRRRERSGTVRIATRGAGGREQAHRERRVCRAQAECAHPVLEAGTQPAGHHVVVHDVRQRGDARGAREAATGPRPVRLQGLVAHGPEQRTGVVHGIADQGELRRQAADVPRLGIPDPLTGGVGAGGSAAAAASAADGDRGRAQYAGEAAGAQRTREQGDDAARRVMVLGGGMIGAGLCDALLSRGHRVILATRGGRGREGAEALALDFNILPDDAVLVAAMHRVDVVVNTVGIFRQTAQQGFDAVHVKGPRRVFAAAARAGVERVIQLSALGADAGSPLPYFSSKGCAEEELRGLAIEHSIVRPSLVFSPGGASTRWFAQLAGVPLLPLPGGGNQSIQPVHLQDLLEAVVRLVEAPQVPRTLDAVGPHPLRLRDYLGLFRQAIGGVGFTIAVPGAVARSLARVAALAPRVPVDPDALAMLDAGNTSDPAPFTRWLGRDPRPPRSFFTDAVAAAMRGPALLGWAVPLMRWTLAFMWVATGIISLWLYPRELSLQMLARVGLQGVLGDAALWSAALLDLALGLALLSPRWRTLAYAAQFALVLGYTVIISVWLPEQWLHPFGPVLKNLPLLAMILAMMSLDRRPWT
jgi:uncharacterized protein YbjT (DUF2867 family)